MLKSLEALFHSSWQGLGTAAMTQCKLRLGINLILKYFTSTTTAYLQGFTHNISARLAYRKVKVQQYLVPHTTTDIIIFQHS